ncbi:MAG: TAXI family TRAP transporter solute-binding subunit, partial [Alphaproteobacteria bacterium]
RLQSEADDIDVAFIQGGVVAQPPPDGLEALGSVFLEPLWIFVSLDDPPKWLSDLKGRRLAIGAEGSGTRVFVGDLLRANMVTEDNSTLVSLGGSSAVQALQAGSVDAAFFVASPEAEVVQALLNDPAFKLMSIERSGAYRQNYRFLKTVTLAQGAADLGMNRPSHDVTLLAPAASLVAREGIHPTLVDLLLLAATDVHRRGDLFSARGEFPSDKLLDFPLNDEARRYLTSGPPLLQRHLPFWIATFLERMAILLIPLLTLLIPLIRILPPVLDWRIRRRIYRWYDELNAVEEAAANASDPKELDALRSHLDLIERKLMQLSVPRHRSDLVFNLRTHVKLIRDRLAS